MSVTFVEIKLTLLRHRQYILKHKRFPFPIYLRIPMELHTKSPCQLIRNRPSHDLVSYISWLIWKELYSTSQSFLISLIHRKGLKAVILVRFSSWMFSSFLLWRWTSWFTAILWKHFRCQGLHSPCPDRQNDDHEISKLFCITFLQSFYRGSFQACNAFFLKFRRFSLVFITGICVCEKPNIYLIWSYAIFSYHPSWRQDKITKYQSKICLPMEYSLSRHIIYRKFISGLMWDMLCCIATH